MAWYDSLVHKKMQEQLTKKKKTRREQTLSKKGPCPEYPDSPHFKSSWERNIYRFLNFMHWTHIKYEPMIFRFPTPFFKALDYKPDFFTVNPTFNGELPVAHYKNDKDTLPFKVENGTFKIIEVKGRLDGKSRTKLRGFKKHFPEHEKNLIIITESKNHPWIQKHLPQAQFMDYYRIKKNIGSMAGFE